MPLVEGLSFSQTNTLYADLVNLNYFISADIYGGYQSNLFQLVATDQIVFNPALYGEVASHFYVELELIGWAKYRVNIDLEGLKFDLLDLQIVWPVSLLSG